MNNVWFNAAKAYYPRFYTVDQVRLFVQANKISPEQFKEICGVDYQTESAK